MWFLRCRVAGRLAAEPSRESVEISPTLAQDMVKRRRPSSSPPSPSVPGAGTQPLFIEDDAALAKLARQIGTSARVAVDTEAASYHRYRDRVYLVQLSSDRVTAVIDPLAVSDLRQIGKLLSDPDTEVVFHDADYDLRVLDRDYGFRARNIFDTRIAAQLLGEAGVGLGALLESHFGITLDKRMQRADWSRRPLTAEMLAYAAADTQHLLALRDRLAEALREKGRAHWAKEEFERLQGLRWSAPEEEGFLRLKGAKTLPGRALAVLREVWRWREEKAAELDRAPFRVMSNDALLALAKARPTGRRSLANVSGFPQSVARRYGEELIEAVGKGLETPPDQAPAFERGKRPRTNKAAEARLARLKALRNERAKAIGLDAGVICPNGTLLAIARTGPSESAGLDVIEELRHWQREALGEDALLAASRGK